MRVVHPSVTSVVHCWYSASLAVGNDVSPQGPVSSVLEATRNHGGCVSPL